MSAEILEQSFASTAAVLAQVTADQLDGRTPCASWSVRDLVNHVVGGATFFAVTAETGAAPTGRLDRTSPRGTSGRPSMREPNGRSPRSALPG